MTKAMTFSIAITFLLITPSWSQNLRTRNIIVVTLDGLRWQEVFNGCDPELLPSDRTHIDPSKFESFSSTSSIERREKLMPFFWKTVGTQGQIYGNRKYGNYVNCSNPYWFSYPGYSEMLVGYVDRSVRSNKAIDNRNISVLEFINSSKGFENKVGAFATWEVMANIACKSLPRQNVITGKECTASESALAKELVATTDVLAFHPNDVRHDAVTFTRAFEFLKRERPRALLISFDETDEHAHGGRYGEYLKAAHNTDKMIELLWRWVQSTEGYEDETTLIITTDHGRGHNNKRSWKGHGRLSFGSGQIWMAVIGPDTDALGEMKNKDQYWQKQFARTAAAFLSLDYSSSRPVGAIIRSMISHPSDKIGDPGTTQSITSSTEPD